jgi:hypothetical protein
MDPDNELYDAACELVAAAQRVQEAFVRQGVAPALPASLGCIESSLTSLAAACEVPRRDSADRPCETFHALAMALDHAAKACRRARIESRPIHAPR